MEETPALNAHNKEEYPPMHTAEHILNQTMVRMFGCERSRDAHIERKKSKINYQLPAMPTEFVERSSVPQEVSLDKLPGDASSTLRLVRIGDYDVCACIGLHVSHTAEIGQFHINSTSWQDGRFRIVFKLI